MSTPTSEPGGDPRAELMVRTILECLCGGLADAGRPACCCTWIRAQRTEMPQACDCTCGGGEGVTWVRISDRRFDRDVTRSTGFDGKNCAVRWVEEWTLDVGISRCWPGGEDGLTCEQDLEVAADGAWDEDLLLQAMLCCEPLRRYSVVPVRVNTLGPEGGCIAAVGEFIVQPGTRPSGDYGYGS